jgi:hypothetical protein
VETELLQQILDALQQLVQQENTEQPLLLNKSKTAQLLDCSTKSVERLTKQGFLTPYRLLGRVMYKRNEIIEFVNGLTDE